MDLKEPAVHSTLDPTAPSFTMDSQTNLATNGTVSAEPLPNGSSKLQKKPKRPDNPHKSSSLAEKVAEAGAGASLSGAELKKQKAAEKAARRAQVIAEKGIATPAPPPPAQPPSLQRRPSTGKKDDAPHHRRTGSKSLPLRPAPSTTEHTPAPSASKKVAIFSHLYPTHKRPTLASAGKEVHPAVLTLGLQLRDFVICGSTARTVAMLLVFKHVIAAYTTPPGTALSRHLTTHLSHQIGFLSSCRSLSVSQGNSIRWLKQEISKLDPDLDENAAKTYLIESLDGFVRERVTLADQLIVKAAGERIVDGDVILTFAKSSVVEKALIKAWQGGKRFRVVVVDSRPLFEGRNLAKGLAGCGIPVQYCLLSGLADVVGEATKCFLGASAMLGNGRLYSRAGSAMVAMMAKEAANKIPVIVLCESIKFTGRVALDSVVMNEIGDSDSLIEIQPDQMLTTVAPPAPVPAKKGGKKDEENAEDTNKKKKGLEGWRDQQNLHLLNLMYDVTPAEDLDMVITELGNLPPTAVPVVNGIQGGDE